MTTTLKRIPLLVVAILMILFSATDMQAQARFGIKAGINVNKIHLDNLGSNWSSDNRTGFTGGIMGEFQIPIIGICFDASLLYSHMNSEVTFGTDEEKPAKDFLQVPINLKYKFPIPIVRPFIYTGPDFAFKIAGDNNIFKTKTFQMAWNVGAGLELFSHLQLSAGYAFGINNIAEGLSSINTSDDIKVKNSYWTITAAYLF